MEVLIIGIFTFFNFAVLKWKYDRGREADLTLDIFVLIALSFLFGGTMSGMAIAMVASFLFSLYLLISPPTWEDVDA